MQTMLSDNPVRLKERRLANRVQKTWKACAEGRLPSWSDIRELDLGVDWESCFAVDLALSHDSPYFIYLGEKLSRLYDLYIANSSGWETPPLELIARKMDRAALDRAPVSYADTMHIPAGRRIVFRSVLLPLSDNGEDVTHIFGAANGKGV